MMTKILNFDSHYNLAIRLENLWDDSADVDHLSIRFFFLSVSTNARSAFHDIIMHSHRQIECFSCEICRHLGKSIFYPISHIYLSGPKCHLFWMLVCIHLMVLPISNEINGFDLRVERVCLVYCLYGLMPACRQCISMAYMCLVHLFWLMYLFDVWKSFMINNHFHLMAFIFWSYL